MHTIKCARVVVLLSVWPTSAMQPRRKGNEDESFVHGMWKENTGLTPWGFVGSPTL